MWNWIVSIFVDAARHNGIDTEVVSKKLKTVLRNSTAEIQRKDH